MSYVCQPDEKTKLKFGKICAISSETTKKLHEICDSNKDR